MNFKNHYIKIILIIAALYQLTAIVIFFQFPQYVDALTIEFMLGENIAAAAWGVGLLLCLIKLSLYYSRDESLMQWIWLFLSCTLGFTRELDMHKLVEKISGMTWKTEWLYNSANSIILQIFMYGMMISVVGGMLGSVVYNHKIILKEIKAGNILITLFTIGFIMMGAGFACDGSVFGKKLIYPIVGRDFGILMEEVLETSAAFICCMSIVPFFGKRKNLLTLTPS